MFHQFRPSLGSIGLGLDFPPLLGLELLPDPEDGGHLKGRGARDVGKLHPVGSRLHGNRVAGDQRFDLGHALARRLRLERVSDGLRQRVEPVVIATHRGQILGLILGGKRAQLAVDLADRLLLLGSRLKLELVEGIGQLGTLLGRHALKPGPGLVKASPAPIASAIAAGAASMASSRRGTDKNDARVRHDAASAIGSRTTKFFRSGKFFQKVERANFLEFVEMLGEREVAGDASRRIGPGPAGQGKTQGQRGRCDQQPDCHFRGVGSPGPGLSRSRCLLALPGCGLPSASVRRKPLKPWAEAAARGVPRFS